MNRQGRLCALYNDSIGYSTPDGLLSGVVSTAEEYTEAVWSIMEKYFTDKVSVGLRYFNDGGIYGLCPKSFPIMERNVYLLSILNLCCGGESGSELLHLPEEGSILEQPNIFMQAYAIYKNEIIEHRIREMQEIERSTKK